MSGSTKTVVQPDNFVFTSENAEAANVEIVKYPEGWQESAVMPLLDLAQRQHDGWLPRAAMDTVAGMLGMAPIRVYEVATFYTMYNLVPVGKFHVQVCGTTPCMLRGSDDIIAACKKRGMKKGEVSEDGLWTLTEVECMGNCATAPMVQINDDNYEDLTPERLDAILDELAAGKQPKTGTQIEGKRTSEPEGGPTTLKDMVGANHDYRGEW